VVLGGSVVLEGGGLGGFGGVFGGVLLWFPVGRVGAGGVWWGCVVSGVMFSCLYLGGCVGLGGGGGGGLVGAGGGLGGGVFGLGLVFRGGSGGLGCFGGGFWGGVGGGCGGVVGFGGGGVRGLGGGGGWGVVFLVGVGGVVCDCIFFWTAGQRASRLTLPVLDLPVFVLSVPISFSDH